MAAVALYALPMDARDPVSQWLRAHYPQAMRSYVLWTSQWQQWNIFAPDPLRRVTTYRIDVRRGEAWYPILAIEPGTYPWWRHAAQFKFLGNIHDIREGPRVAAMVRFLQSHCAPFGLAPGTELRLVQNIYVVPNDGVVHTTAWWNAWRPQQRSEVSHIAMCLPPA